MKKHFKSIGAIALAVTMTIGMATTAFAANLTDGEVGGFTTPDTPTVQEKTINLDKELKVFNASSNSVYAPVFAYTYTVTPANVNGITVTDETTDHASGEAVTAPVNAGITTGLKVNSGNAGTAASAVGTLSFTNETSLDASAAGAVNSYDIPFDFSGVTFQQTGIYRYQIDETLANSATYTGLGMADGTNNTVYLDVYVDGAGEIYGYVCMKENASVTPATEKTNGFVDGSNGADSYYTYDLTISKDVVNDSYAENNHAFPFTVIFNKGELTGSFRITEVAAEGSTGINPAAGEASWSGVALVKDGAAVTLKGIPCGADAEIYETNDMTGVTYTVGTSVNGGEAATDNNVSWGATPGSAAAQAAKKAYESTKQAIDTTVATAVDAAQTFAVTNTLVTISPTGVVLRFAPYLMMLAAGIAILIIFRARRIKVED